MKKILIIFIIFFISLAHANSIQEDDYVESYLDSDRYFNYLIERNQLERNKNPKPQEIKEETKEEITLVDYNPIKLRAGKTVQNQKYKEVYKEENSNNTFSLNDKIELYQNSSTSLNANYYSREYKSLTGVELKPSKFINLSSGIESKYRFDDQNQLSKKLYFSPKVLLGKKASLIFHNKINVQDNSYDNDIEFIVSPFKSNAADFGVYSGTTHKQNGAMSQSINFSTNFYF